MFPDSKGKKGKAGNPNMASLDAEEQAYLEEVKAVKQWWTDSRWRYTRRPFTAEQIVQKRGTIKMTYNNNVQSKKLWNIVEGRFKVSFAFLVLLNAEVKTY